MAAIAGVALAAALVVWTTRRRRRCPECNGTGEIDIWTDEDGDGFVRICDCQTS